MRGTVRSGRAASGCAIPRSPAKPESEVRAQKKGEETQNFREFPEARCINEKEERMLLPGRAEKK